MFKLLLVVILSTATHPPVPCPHPSRSKAAAERFHRQHPCPGGPDKGSKTRCSGYVIDHVCPLACCGQDAISNMQWQTTKDGKVKDKVELQCSRFCHPPASSDASSPARPKG